jgi:hypothetical protein
MPTIDVLVSPTGETKIETRGFAGPACQQATKDLEAALGLKQSETLTAEYHLSAHEEAGVAAQSETPG